MRINRLSCLVGIIVVMLFSSMSFTSNAVASEEDSTKVTAKCFQSDTLMMEDFSYWDDDGNFAFLANDFTDRINAEVVTVDGIDYLLYTKMEEQGKSPRTRYLAGKMIKFSKAIFFNGRTWEYQAVSKECKALSYLLRRISAGGQPTKLHDPKVFYANDFYKFPKL
jgi:hypothetical protein